MDKILHKENLEAFLALAQGKSIQQAAKSSGVKFRNLHYLAKLWTEIGYLTSERNGRELKFKPTEKGCGILGVYTELKGNIVEIEWDSTDVEQKDQ